MQPDPKPVDLSRLSQGDKIAAASAVVLLVVMSFFSWFETNDQIAVILSTAPGVDSTPNAWQSFHVIDIVLLFTCVAAIASTAVKASEADFDFPMSTIVTVLGALSTILVLYRVVDPPADYSTKLGIFLGLISAAALTYGGWLEMEDEGTAFEDSAHRHSSDDPDAGPGSGGNPPSTPPPPGSGGGPPPST